MGRANIHPVYDPSPADYSTFDRKITLKICLGRISDQWAARAELLVDAALAGQLAVACTISCTGIIGSMKENEIPIVAGPRTDYMDVLVSALNEEHIPARIISIAEVEPASRPVWACTPGDEVYVVVPLDKREGALELTRWVSRVCLECETFLLPKVRACQKCGTPHPMEPGPQSLNGLA